MEKENLIADIHGCYHEMPEDVKKVVFCKDCKSFRPASKIWDSMPYCDYFTSGNGWYDVFTEPNWFCSRGERKDDGKAD